MRLADLTLVVALSLLAIAPLRAADLDEGTVLTQWTAKGVTVTQYALATLESHPGEGKDAFLLRVAQYMGSYTYAKQVEVCGMIWVRPTGDAWAVPLGTLRSHVHCTTPDPIPPDLTGQGWLATGESIHSHPRAPRVVISALDAALGADNEGDVLMVDVRQFSPDDLKHPGYLVAGRRLTYQSQGGRYQRVIGGY